MKTLYWRPTETTATIVMLVMTQRPHVDATTTGKGRAPDKERGKHTRTAVLYPDVHPIFRHSSSVQRKGVRRRRLDCKVQTIAGCPTTRPDGDDARRRRRQQKRWPLAPTTADLRRQARHQVSRQHSSTPDTETTDDDDEERRRRRQTTRRTHPARQTTAPSRQAEAGTTSREKRGRPRHKRNGQTASMSLRRNPASALKPEIGILVVRPE